MKRVWKIITYPLYIPGILNRKFWLHVSRRIAKIQQSEAAKAHAKVVALRAKLMETEAEVEKLKAVKKELIMQLEMELMDKYIS